jgi:transglutaminase-like putative cysteine protease
LTYSLDVADRGSEAPLSRFLFDGMHGHCEYFATAMVVLSREAEIPSRFVAGYLRGEKSRFGNRYVVRQSDAHSWVEIYFPEIGWVPFDPTPPAGRGVSEARGPLAIISYLYSSVTRLWDDYLVGIDLDDQARGLLVLTGTIAATTARLRAALDSLTSSSPLYLGLLIVSSLVLSPAAVVAWRRLQSRRMRRKDRTDGVLTPAFYETVLQLLARQGLSRRAGETPVELAARAESVLTRRAADRLRELTRLYYRVRFDSSTDVRQVHRIARALLSDIRNGLLAC